MALPEFGVHSLHSVMHSMSGSVDTTCRSGSTAFEVLLVQCGHNARTQFCKTLIFGISESSQRNTSSSLALYVSVRHILD